MKWMNNISKMADESEHIKPNTMKEYPCPLSDSGKCRYGGNKHYNYGFTSGTASYCSYKNEWISTLGYCPLINDKS